MNWIKALLGVVIVVCLTVVAVPLLFIGGLGLVLFIGIVIVKAGLDVDAAHKKDE